ncbi:hypothetical protein [Marinococcus halophilus]|uniref:hypothetical protein n=1 Tax=Marinococcus halophilus TaxID=1371 RepID=UPI0009A70049|nr:hypothetical protein [Marinococcus halophilus]
MNPRNKPAPANKGNKGVIIEDDFKTFYLNRMKKRIRLTVLFSVFTGAALILQLINPPFFRLIIYTAMYAFLIALGEVISFNSQVKQEYRSNASLKI